MAVGSGEQDNIVFGFDMRREYTKILFTQISCSPDLTTNSGTTNSEFTNFVTMKKCFLTMKTINKNKGTRLVDLVLISWKFGFVVSELVVGSGEQDDTVWYVIWLQLKNTTKIPPNILLTGFNNQIGNYESKIVRPSCASLVCSSVIVSL